MGGWAALYEADAMIDPGRKGITALAARDAMHFRAIVTQFDNSAAHLAVTAPLSEANQEAIKTLIRRTVLRENIVSEEEFAKLWRLTYPSDGRDEATDATRRSELLDLIDHAYNHHVTDMHFEYALGSAAEVGGRIRMRRDGRVQTALTRHLNKDTVQKYVNIITTESKATQSDKHTGGGWRIELNSGRTVDLRVQMLDALRGREASLRLTGTDARLFRLNEMQIPRAVYALIAPALRSLSGGVVITGEVNSGKSTLQRAIALFVIDYIANVSGGREEARVVSFEKPVELEQDFTQVSLDEGETFEQLNSRIVRTDYDLLNFGEINDENIGVFFSAALAGRYVTGSFHGNGVFACLSRILDMDIKPSTIGTALRLIIHTRTSQKLCPTCRVREPIPLSDRSFLAAVFAKDGAGHADFEHGYRRGEQSDCPTCGGLGVTGIKPFFEVLKVTPELMAFYDDEKKRGEILQRTPYVPISPQIKDAICEGDIPFSIGITMLHSL